MEKPSPTAIIILVAVFLVVVVFVSRLVVMGNKDGVFYPRSGRSVGVTLDRDSESGESIINRDSNEIEMMIASIYGDLDLYSVGDTVIVTLQTQSGYENAVAAQLSLAYDPLVLSFVSASQGELFSSAREIGPEDTGSVVNYGLLIFPGSDPVNGEGEIAVFTFEAISEGSAIVALTDNSIVSAVGTSSRDILGPISGITVTVTSSTN